MPLPYDSELTSKITHALDREQNERLYIRVMAGDDKAREEMIEGNMPLVINKVDAYIGCYPQAAHLRDDLHSAGFLALVQAVNTMVEHDRPSKANPTGYLSVAITHEIAKLAEKEADMGLTNVPSAEESEESGDNRPTVYHDIPESFEDPKQEAMQRVIEMRDMLDACCQCEEERTLLRMREEGYSDRDIAKALNMPHTAAYTLRKELEQRFNQKCRELEE